MKYVILISLLASVFSVNTQSPLYNRFSVYDTINNNHGSINSAFPFSKSTEFKISPVVNGLANISSTKQFSSLNEAGLLASLSAKQFSAFGLFTYGISVLDDNTLTFLNTYQTLPGYGLTYSKNSRQVNFYSLLGGVSYKPWEFLKISLQNNRLQLGDGYRSHLLSDATPAYPHLTLETKFGRNFRYLNVFAIHKNNNPFNRELFSSYKFMASHYLSISIGKKVSLGLYESVIWGNSDALGNRGFDVNYLNPFVFYRPVEYANGSADNSIIGSNLKYSPASWIDFYGQFVIDEFLLSELRAKNGWWANKYAIQVGLFVKKRLKKASIFARAEANIVRPFTFTHSRSEESYTHANTPLAHPLGANFKEYVGIAAIKSKKFLIEGKLIYAIQGKGSDSTNIGSNILKSYVTREADFGNFIGQGISQERIQASLLIMYQLLGNKPYWLSFETQAQKISSSKSLLGFEIGLQTVLWNRYKDYY